MLNRAPTTVLSQRFFTMLPMRNFPASLAFFRWDDIVISQRIAVYYAIDYAYVCTHIDTIYTWYSYERVAIET